MNTENTVLEDGIASESFTPNESNLATTGQRIINYLIDFIIVMIGIVATYVVFDLMGFSIIDNEILSRLIGAIIMVIYYTLTEMNSGRSLGKLVTKTRVVDKNGEVPTASQIFKRSLSRVVPFEALSAFSSSKLMWHDKWSDTYTIRTK